MSDKGKHLHTSVWFKEPFVCNASRVIMDPNQYVVDFLERVIEEKQLEHASATKASLFNVTHKGQLIPHDAQLKNITGITTKDLCNTGD